MAGSQRGSLSYAMVGCIMIAAIVRFGYFAMEPPGRDQGVFSNLADGLLHGKLLYRDLWENKPPAIAWLYAAAIAVFGRGYVAIHLLQAIFATLTAILVAWIIRRAGGTAVAATSAAILYVIHAGGLTFGGWWGTAQAEVFMDLPIAAALALLLAARGASGRRALLRMGLAGLCVGWILLLKYSAAPLIALGLVAWRSPRVTSEEFMRNTAFAAGCALPPALLALGMAASGAWVDFLRATVEFNAAYRAATTPSAMPLVARLFDSPARLLALYAGAAASFVGAALTARKPLEHAPLRTLIAAAAWLWILALTEVFWQGKFWLYHFHVILLPLALLAGAGMSWPILMYGTNARLLAAPATTVAVLALLSIPYAGDLVAYDRDHAISARWIGRASAEQMEATYTWGYPDYEFAQTKAVAAALAAAVPPGQRIFVWGFEPYVYFLSRLEPASRFQYDLPLMPSFTKLHPIFAQQLMEDLERHPPAVVIVVANDANDVEPQDSVRQLLEWPQLRAFVESHYQPAWRTGDFLCLTPRAR